MKNLTPEMIEKAKVAKSAEELLEIAKANGAEELEDEMLDGVSGGLVQLINPSSSRFTLQSGMTVKFGDGRVCPTCGHKYFIYNSTNFTNTATCKQCGYVITGFTKYDVSYIET